MKRIVIVWIACVLVTTLLVGWAGLGISPHSQQAVNATSGEHGEALIKADFTLQTTGNKTVRSGELKGKYLLVYFGFTHCPDVCPTALLVMSNVLSHIGSDAAKIQPIFITIDPARDTPDETATYARNFGKNFLGLSGTEEQVKQAADGFKVYYSKVPQPKSALGYAMDHSSFIYLIGPDGNYLTHFASTDPEQEIIEGLHQYVR